MTATSEHYFTSLSGCVEESRVSVVSEGEFVAGSMVSAGESKYAGLREQQAEPHAGKMIAGEVDAEDQVAAMEAVNSRETGASELASGWKRENRLQRIDASPSR